jgi:hypothetical protein
MNAIMLLVGLVGLGFMAGTPTIFILNIAGLPGALLTLGDDKSSGYHAKFLLGTLISFLCQAFVYFAYMAFVVKSVQHIPAGTSSIIIVLVWLAALFASINPINFARSIAQREHFQDNNDTPNANLNGLSMAWIASGIAFLVFSFAPDSMKSLWGWVPSF